MKFPNFIKIATIPKTRLVEVNKVVVKKQFQECAEEMLIKLFAEKLGFSYQIIYSEDEEYGRRLADGNWTGMVGLLQHKRADLIFHRMTMTEERLEVMDYSFPYVIDRITFATRKFERTVSPDTFLKPFTFQVWIAFALCFCITPIIYSLLFERKHSLERLIASRIFRDLSEVSKRKYSECIFKMFWEIFNMLVRWCYTALVLSFLAFPTLSGVRNTEELAAAIAEGRYSVTASPGSFVPNMLLKSGGHLSIIGDDLKKAKETLDFESALEETGINKKIAVIASEIDLLHIKEKHVISNDEFLHVIVIIGIGKDFCCKRQLESVISNLWPSGIYQFILNKGMLVEEYGILKQLHKSVAYESSERSISLEDFKGVFALLACGYSLAITVLLLELVHSKCRYV